MKQAVTRCAWPIVVAMLVLVALLTACSCPASTPANTASTPANSISDHPAVKVLLDYWEAMNDFDAEKALSYYEPTYREERRERVKENIAQMAPLKFMNFRLTIIQASEPVYIEDNKVEVHATLKTPIDQRYLLYQLVQVGGEWKISKQTTDPTKSPPRAPSGLTAVATSGTQIDLSWADNTTIEDGYRIERATNSDFTKDLKTFTVEADVVTYNDVSVASATTYYYRVFAFDPAGDSPATNTVKVTTP